MSTNSNKIVIEENNYSLSYETFIYNDTPQAADVFEEVLYSAQASLNSINGFRIPRGGFITGASFSFIQTSGAAIDVQYRITAGGSTIFTSGTIQAIDSEVTEGGDNISSGNKIEAGDRIQVQFKEAAGEPTTPFEVAIIVEFAVIRGEIG